MVDGAGRYGFRHALLREVVYDDLLPGERSELHLVCAHALERGAAGGDGAWTATGIAHHYYSAGDQPRALESALAAARSVQRLHAYGEAAGLLDRALELWNRVPDPEEHAGADHAEILARAGRAHYLAGDEEMGAALYEAAAGEIDEEADPERAAKVLTMLATCQWSLGLADRSRATQRRGLELAREDSPERAELLAQRVRFLLLQGRFRDVRDDAPEALEAGERAGLGRDAGVVNRLGCALFALGEDEEARARLDESIELALAAGTSDDIATAFLNYADALHLAGRSDEARDVGRRGLAEVSKRAGSGGTRSMRWIRLNMAEIEFDLGDWAKADEQLRPSGAVYRGVALAHADLRRAQLALGRGEHDVARQVLDHADALLANALEPQYIALLAASRAELERRGGDLGAAAAEVDRGIDRIQFCSEDAGRLALVAAAGATIAADASERARDLGDDAAEATAVARAEGLVELIRAAAEDGDRPCGARPGRDRRGGAVQGPRRGRSRALGRGGHCLGQRRAALQPRPGPVAPGAGRARPKRPGRRRGDPRRRDRGRRRDRRHVAQPGGEGLRRSRPARHRGARRNRRRRARAAGDQPFGLTPRERQVLELLATGATNREIAEQLYMAEKTASVHVSRILTKLDVRGRTEAAAVAHRQGLAGEPSPVADSG